MPNNPIRIGYVVHKMQIAGAEVLIDRMITYGGDRFSPVVFCLDDVGALGERLRNEGVPVVVLGRKPGLDRSLASRFAAELGRYKIEILHAHQYTPFFYSALAKLCCLRTAPKLILTEHGRHFPDVASLKRKVVNRFLFSYLANNINACSHFSAKGVTSVDWFPYCDVIPNGVPLDRFTPRGTATEVLSLRDQLELERNRVYVTCVARFHPVKDHRSLLAAWRIVNQRFPEAHLLLLGDGEDRSQLEALSAEHGIANVVRFLGAKNNVQDYLRCTDIFTLTSVTEASPLTLLEAMACNCPSVVTDVGGNSEHVEHGKEAMLAIRQNPESIASNICYLLEDENRRVEMGNLARQRVERDFDQRICLDKYIALYRRLMPWKKVLSKSIPSQLSDSLP